MDGKIGKTNSSVVIAGAGPAGASLAVRLAQHGFAVTLIERERFPRHKLCGEFISPEALRLLAEIGVKDDLLSAGAERVYRTRFTARSGRGFTMPSGLLDGEGFAVSLSRFAMDKIILDRAKAAGVRVLEGTRITKVLGSGDEIAAVETAGDDNSVIRADLFVDATGRAMALRKTADRDMLSRRKTPPRAPLAIAFKTHLRGARIEPRTCEMFFFPGGYGGLTRIEDGLANLCFIMDTARARRAGADADTIVRDIVRLNPAAAGCLQKAERAMDWIAVSIGSFGRTPPPAARNLLSIGDAAAFIDPFTGSGMLMALESAELLAGSIAAGSALGTAALREAYNAAHHRNFASRLRFSSVLRRAASLPVVPSVAISLLGLSRRGRRYLAAATRPARSAGAKIG